MSTGNDEEVFLSLDDDDVLETPKATEKATRKPRVKKPKKPFVAPQEVLDAEILDAVIIRQATGQFEIGWALMGMDCPDCASKATRALNMLPQVTETAVSATAGTVKLTVDLEHGSLSQASSVLRSLGHAPDVGFNELVGIRSSHVAHRNNVDQRKLGKIFRQQPGVLDVEFTDDERILLQFAPDIPRNLFELRDSYLTEIIGSPVKYVPAESYRIRPDQWRLIGGGIALPLLLLVILGDLIGLPPLFLVMIAVPGLAIGGSQMFNEAFASIRNRQLGFQVLTSLAVIGAAILGMWQEALVVAILVAFSAHLEGDALVKARKAMQGGLDRLPRTARRVTGNKPKKFESKKVIAFSLQMSSSPLLGADGCALPDPLPCCQNCPRGTFDSLARLFLVPLSTFLYDHHIH